MVHDTTEHYSSYEQTMCKFPNFLFNVWLSELILSKIQIYCGKRVEWKLEKENYISDMAKKATESIWKRINVSKSNSPDGHSIVERL